MTNETELHANGAADEVATIAAITAETSTPTEIAAEPEAVAEIPPEPKPPSFDDLGLHPDVKLALDDMGYFTPTAVQTAVFKPVSENKDLLVQSKTGTGKTTAFGLPMINRLIPTHRAPQALILAPTRELALQVARELTQIGKHRGIIVEAIYGGAPIGKQITNLKNGVHIIVGTPGRVLDHIGRRTLDCKAISTFVLDECDEMLSMGFLEDIQRVVSYLPEKKQTLLFSATMPDEVKRYSRQHMVAPEQISLSRDSISVTDIHHAYYIVSGIARGRDLLKVIFAENPDSAIIFCNMRDETTMVAKFLMKQGLDAEPLSSDLSQSDRERVMGRMKAKNLRFLVATDVAARGIDISDLSHVINFSVPESPEVYVHRTGRTGRAGKKGTALSLVGPRELGSFRYVRLQFGIKPEERVLPKDDIFVGKLKVPLPPIGTPQPPDPVQILIRGVPGNPTELERQIFEKLLGSASGKRVLAQLVAAQLDKLSTRSKPKRAPRAEGEGAHGEEAHVGGEHAERGDRPSPAERSDRPERGGFGDRDRGERGGGRFDRDRGERPRWGRDRDDRGGGGGGGGDRPGGDRPGGERPSGDRPDRGERGERSFDRGDRDRGFRGDRDRDRGPRPDRGAEGAPSAAPADAAASGGAEGERKFDRDRGDRGGRFDRDRDRGDRDRGPRPDRGERAEGAPTAAPADAAAGGADGERKFDRDRDRGDRGGRFDRDRGDRGDRGGRFDRDRGDRGERRFDRDRDRGGERPAPVAPTTSTEDAPVVIAEPATEGAAADVTVEARPVEARDRDRDRDRGDRGDRHGRDRDRDRGGDRNRDRDRGRDRQEARSTSGGDDIEQRTTETFEAVTAVPGTEAAPSVETTETPSKVGDVARAVIDRKSKAKRTAPTEETREFWETWAEEKTTREPAPAAAAAETEAASESTDDAEARPSRTSRDKGSRDKERGRGGRDKERGASRDKRTKSDTKADKPEKADKADKPEKAEARAKRDTVQTPPAVDGAQARLFVSLGKKHGVSADDLRELLAGAIGGDKARIGSVSLRDSHAHVRVPEDLAEKIIEGVHGTQHNEHDVTVERARA